MVQQGSIISGHTQLTGVMGWPVSHTKSPPMQNAAIASAGLDAVYLPLPVHPDRVGEALKGLRALGFLGVNVTIPHKMAVIDYLDELTAEARVIGAVNAIRVEQDGRLVGHNTDCEGAVRAVETDGTEVRGRTVAILGAGGAGRGAAAGCAFASARKIIVLNRTLEKAQKLVEEFAACEDFSGVEWECSTLREGCDWPSVDVVMQMTSLGMYGEGEIPWSPERLPGHSHVLDAVYHPLETKFLAQARQQGLRTSDGLSMLLEQGAAAFEFWFHLTPDRETMRSALLSGAE